MTTTKVRTISIQAVGCLNMPWSVYLEKQYSVWDASTHMYNGLVGEFYRRDIPPYRNPVSPDAPVQTELKVIKDVFEKNLWSLGYDLCKKNSPSGLSRFTDKLPSASIASMTGDIARAYSNNRRGAMQHQNVHLPLSKFPYPITIPADSIVIDVDPKDERIFTVEFPFFRSSFGVIEKAVLQLRSSRNDRNTTGKNKVMPQSPLLEQLRQGRLKFGSATISGERRMVSASEARELPVRRDARRNRFVFEPIIGFSVNFPVSEENAGRRGLVLIHTDPKLFLVARVDQKSRWDLNQDHIRQAYNVHSPAQMRDIVNAHDGQVKRLRQDAKALDRGSRIHSRKLCEKQARRLSNFINNMVAIEVENIVKRGFAEVFFCNDAFVEEKQRYMPHFPWFLFSLKLKEVLERESIPFTELETWDFQDCKNEAGQFDHSRIYFKLRSNKAGQTKRDKNANELRKKEDGLDENGQIAA